LPAAQTLQAVNFWVLSSLMVRVIKVATGDGRNNGNVVFVHGLGGHPIETWGGVTERNPGDEFWPRWIADSFPELAVYSIGYEALKFKWEGEAQPLLNIGEDVLETLLADPQLSERPIAFVCHSLGGLVVKSLIYFAQQRRLGVARRLFGRIAQVIFLGTPHNGSGLANLLTSLRLATTLTHELQKSNDSLLGALNKFYKDLPGNEGLHIETPVFRETRPVGIWPWRAMVVPRDSAHPQIDGVTVVDVRGANHIDICKPAGCKSQVYDETIKLLRTLHSANPQPTSGLSTGFDAFESYYLKGEAGAPVPFGGRDRELAGLTRWLDAGANPRLLLSAPAGRGKSALVVKWIDHLKRQHKVNRPNTRQLISIPVSNRFGTNSPIVYLGRLAGELAHIADELAPDITVPEDNLRGRISQLLGRIEGKGTPLLLVFDGLDEALITDGVETLQGLIPIPFPANLRLLVSARWLVGDTDGSGWRSKLGWTSAGQTDAQDVIVEPLDAPAIADVLKQMGAPLDLAGTDRHIVRRLLELTVGEPLLLRFYAEDLWGRVRVGTPVTLDRLDAITPGFAGYFKTWIEQYQGGPAAAGGKGIDCRTVEPALAIFGFAAGPLTGTDFLEIAQAGFPSLPWEVSARKHVQPFQRFLIGNGTSEHPYTLSHPKIAEYLQRDRCRALADRAAMAFYTWGKQHVAAVNGKMRDGKPLPPGKTSRYVLSNYAYHLRNVSDSATTEDYLAMVEDGWRRAKEIIDPTQGAFARDVKAAWKAIAEREGQLGLLGPQWRCALTLSSIASIGSQIPGPLALVALRHGVITAEQAGSYAELNRFGGPETLARIALDRRLNCEEAIKFGKSALRLAMAADSSEFIRVIRLQTVVDTLFSSPETLAAEARDALTLVATRCAMSLTWTHYKAETLARLIPHLAPEDKKRAIASALAAANDTSGGKGRSLSALAQLTRYVSAADLQLIAAETVEAAKLYLDKVALPLAALWQHLSPEQIGDVLRSLKATTHPGARVCALWALVRHLRPEEIAEELKAAANLGDPVGRLYALAALAPRLSPSQIAEVLLPPERIQLAANVTEIGLIPNPVPRVGPDERQVARGFEAFGALAATAPGLDPDKRRVALEETLRAARSLDHERRMLALAGLVFYLEPIQRSEVLAEILADSRSPMVLGAVAHYLTREQTLVALQALRSNIGDQDEQLVALAKLAPRLEEAESHRALVHAVEKARATNNASALGALAAHLSPEQIASNAEWAQAIDSNEIRSIMLAVLAPYLLPDQRYRLVLDGLRAAKASKNMVAWVLLAAHLPLQEKQQSISELLEAGIERKGLSAKHQREEWTFLAVLADHLTSQQIVRAYELAHMISGTHGKLVLNAVLYPRLRDHPKFAEALVRDMKQAQAVPVAGLLALHVSHLSSDQRHEFLREALNATKDMANSHRTARLAELATLMGEPDGRDVMSALLDSVSQTARAESLDAAGKASELIARLGGASAVSQLKRAITDVCSWYP
jgi:hypothetical protein